MPLLRDTVYTLRLWRHNAGTTAAAFVALAVGIAGTTAMFGIVSAVLLQPLPIDDPDRIVSIFTTDHSHTQSLVSMPDAIDLKQRLQTASDVTIVSEKLFNMSASRSTVLVHALVADSGIFNLMGISPAQGSGGILLSWPFWQSQFGGRAVIGERVRLDDRIFTIAGILPRNLDLPLTSDLWVPLEFDLAKPENARAVHAYYAFARLRHGKTLPALVSELSVLSSQLALQNPAEDKGVVFKAISLRDWIAGDVKTPLILLLAAVGGVLLIACANVANLLLARSAARIREMSVRIAVGASRFQLLQQLMTESLMLAACSAVAGAGLAYLALRIVRTLPDSQIPKPESVAIDSHVLLFSVGITCVTAVLFGLLPSLKDSNVPVSDILKQAGGRNSDSSGGHSLRRALVTFETAVTTVLLIASILLLQSFRNVTRLDPGFQADHLLTVFLSLPYSSYGRDSIYAARFADRVLSIVHALPGVKHVAITRNLPLTPGGNGPIQIQGRPQPVHIWEEPFVTREEITSGYRQTLNIPLVRGRDFDQREDVPGATGILINQAVAQRYFHGQNPIGQRISYKIGRDIPPADWHEIVGVIGDTRRGSSQWKLPAIYVPLYRAASPYLAIVVRTEGDPASYAQLVEEAVHKVDPGVPCFLFRTMDEIVRQQLGWRAFNTSLLGIFALVALLLASVGIFSVVAYSVSQRTSEIGLRMACGASRTNILTMILRQGLAPSALGIAVGILGALAFGGYLESQLLGVGLRSPLPYVLSAGLLLLVAAIASFLPARRAIAVDPWVALRYE